VKTKIRCGCGLFCADDLNEYDQHLAEHVADDSPEGLRIAITRASVESVFTEDEIKRMDEERTYNV
jgi:hypothetical protein